MVPKTFIYLKNSCYLQISDKLVCGEVRKSEITREQNIEEIFVQQLDQIYYPGYTEQIMKSQTEKLEWELKEFQSQFSVKN